MIAEIGTYTSIEFKAVSNQFITKRGSTIFFELQQYPSSPPPPNMDVNSWVINHN